MIKKILISLLIVALLLLTILPALKAFAFDDISKEKEDTYLIWNQLGVVNGYKDNTLRLNDAVTKAEFVTIVNRALDFKGSTNISFKDVNETDWFFNEVKTGVANDYIQKEEYFKPNEPLTYLTITPILYKLYDFAPANKDYLAEIKELPDNLNDKVKSQLNTLVKENIIWESYIKDNKPITRQTALFMVEELVREKFVGSLLNMHHDETSRSIFKLLKLDAKQYYYYDLTDTGDLSLGRTPSNMGNIDFGKKIIQRIQECAKLNAKDNDQPLPPAIWIDRKATHIYYGMLNLKKDYVVYKSSIYVNDNVLQVGELEQVLYHDRSAEIIEENKQKEKEKQAALEKQLENYMDMANELGLSFNDYYVYAPDQLNDLLLNKLKPFNTLSKDHYSAIKENLIQIQYQYYNAGDLPFAYWIAKDSNSLYAINIKHNGYYRVLKIEKGEIAEKWITTLLSTKLKASNNDFLNTIGKNTASIFKQLKVNQGDFYYAPHNFTKSQMPSLVANSSVIMSLSMTSMILIDLGGIGSIYPQYFIHKNAREAYALTTKNDNHNELIVVKFTYSPDSNKWISKQVYPKYKDTVYKIPQAQQKIIEELKINATDYVYYPYEKSSIFANNQSGPLVNDTWDLGQKLLNAINSSYNIQFEHDDNYPGVLIKKDGSEAYALCNLMTGENTAFLYKQEMYMYESKGSTRVFPVWSNQQVLPKKQYEVFVAPKSYTNAMVKELKININDYVYYPQLEQSKLSRRYPSLFKNSSIAGSLAFYKASKLLREHGTNYTDLEIGCFIHPDGETVYVIQQKSNNLIYIYKLVLDRTAEGYVEWNDVNDWIIKAE